MESPNSKRQSDRNTVIKKAKIIFLDSVVYCSVINMSETGFRAQLHTMVPVPEQVEVQFPEGATFSAIQRWARGTEIGFEFNGPAKLGTIERAQAWRIYEAIRDRGLELPLGHLRELRFFGDQELTRIVGEIEAAVKQLEAKLRLLGRNKT